MNDDSAIRAFLSTVTTHRKPLQYAALYPDIHGDWIVEFDAGDGELPTLAAAIVKAGATVMRQGSDVAVDGRLARRYVVVRVK